MTFAESLEELLKGNKIKREDWEDDGTHLMMVDNVIHIMLPEDRKYHPLKVSSGDIMGTDWEVLSA